MTMQCGDRINRAYFRSPDLPLQPVHDAAFPAFLLACMFHAWDLETEGPVSRRLLGALPAIMDIYHAWDRSAQRISIRQPASLERAPSAAGRVGLFFSGGVDSSYSLLQHIDEITDLLWVRGFEGRTQDEAARRMVADRIRGVGSQLGKSVIFVESNLRSIMAGHGLRWADHASAPALAAVSHLLGQHFSKIYIAGGSSYAELHPNSSHPLLDPLWSSESLEIVHDGCEATRLEKTLAIAENEAALAWFHPCSSSTVEEYNCGRCTKCVMAAINLHAAGALERCPTLPRPIRLRRVLNTPFLSESSRIRVRETLVFLSRDPRHRTLALALRLADLRGTARRRLKRSFAARTPVVRRELLRTRRILGWRDAANAAPGGEVP